MLAYLRRRSDAGAADAAAEVFLVAWRRLDDVPADSLPWLIGVARRVLANQRRSRRRRHALVARLSGRREVAPDPSDLVAGDALRTAFGRLSAPDREALALVSWEGLSPGRAAAALGCTPAALAVRLHRARRRLAAHLAEVERTALGDDLRTAPDGAGEA